MNAKQSETYRKRLQEQFDEVTGEIRDHSDLGDLEVDPAIRGSEEKLLEKIELALKRLEEGSYGKCIGCDADISSDRLDAKPSVSLCTKCQENKEQK